MSIDPTTAAIEQSIDEREKLRTENGRLEAELSRLRTISDDADRAFEKGFGQAVHEIRDHFKKQKATDVSDTIEKIWLKERP